MKKTLLLLCAIFGLGSLTTYAQITTIGVIGPAATGGWEVDTNLTQDPNDPHVWTGNLDLLTGQAKFRANDDWALNWGHPSFPTGVGELGGDNIEVIGGSYDITFNDSTGAYNFVNSDTTYMSIGIIGTATPGGWDTETPLVQDSANPHLWTLDITLVEGVAKFRANNAWDVSWGGTDFPAGIATTDNGPDIPVLAGEYEITFNSSSGEYSFGFPIPVYQSIGIIGTATPDQWEKDTNMVQDPNLPYIWTMTIQLESGLAKFRADDDWAVNWGSLDFPMGIGTQGGDNIPVVGGEYNITFNHVTGEYNFESTSPIYNSIGLIGTALPDGWTQDTDMIQNPNNPHLWSLSITLADGVAKFRADDDWAVSWGGSDFPMGIATTDNGPDIPVTAGDYNVTFNDVTGEYNFGNPLNIYSSVGIIGSGTALGWDNGDVDMIVDEAQPDEWVIAVELGEGEMKFRAEDNWDVNWGSDNFPAGVGVQDGDNIPTFPGNWIIRFNATTGVYSFTPVSVGIIGSATPTGWDSDTDMDLSGLASHLWSIDMDLVDGAVKFRQDDAWDTNWGSADFPSGTGTQDGDDIPVTAGSYSITVNSATGDYTFTESTSTKNFLDPNTVTVFPNPTSDMINIRMEDQRLQGDIEISLFNQRGQLVAYKETIGSDVNQFDVSNMTAGLYLLQIRSGKNIIGKRLSIIR